MTQFNNPLMSYAELTLPLPCSKDLWFARTAEEFKIRYFELGLVERGKQPPSLGDLLRNFCDLADNHHRIDVQFALSIFLHGFWSLIWEYRQLNSVFQSAIQGAPNSNILFLGSRRADLCTILLNFQQATQGWHELTAQENIVLHLLLLNLHVSMDDLQLFSGKEGEEQARRVYPTLQRWSDTPEARQALWHAGQILRQAKMFPPGHLKDFYAIAVHHAALCIWTYGVVVKASKLGQPRGNLDPGQGSAAGGGRRRQRRHENGNDHNSNNGPPLAHHAQPPPPSASASHGGGGPPPVYLPQPQSSDGFPPSLPLRVYLDGDEYSAMVRGYIEFGSRPQPITHQVRNVRRNNGFNHYVPTIRGVVRHHHHGQQPAVVVQTESSLDQPAACMEIAREILRANFVADAVISMGAGADDGEGNNSQQHPMMPPISENIMGVLNQLALAASGVGL